MCHVMTLREVVACVSGYELFCNSLPFNHRQLHSPKEKTLCIISVKLEEETGLLCQAVIHSFYANSKRSDARA